MKSILLKMLTIVGVLFLTSCSSGDEEITLNLSKKVVQFNKATGEQKITIDTNADNSVAVSSTAWTKASISGNSLIIKVEENQTIYERTADVMVVAGGVVAKLEVKQKGADGTAVVTPEKLELNENGGQIEVEVEANDDNWTAESDVDWVEVEAVQKKGFLRVNYKANEAEEARSGKITIKVGNSNIEIAVTQSGVLLYFLPYLEFEGATMKKIKDFEIARGNTIKDDGKGGKDKGKGGWIEVNTSSKVFDKVNYLYVENRLEFIRVDVRDADDKSGDKATLQKYAKGFEKYLLDNGFVTVEELDNTYYNEEKRVKAILQGSGSYQASVRYEYIPKQTESYPTFDSVPVIDNLNWGMGEQDIETFEANNGGVKNEEQSNSNTDWSDWKFDIDNPTDKGRTYKRRYIIGKDSETSIFKTGLLYYEQVLRNYEMAYFQTNDGRFVLTNEFKQLMENEGYKYKGNNQTYDIFVNKSKNYKVMVAAGPDKDGNIFLVINIERLDKYKK